MENGGKSDHFCNLNHTGAENNETPAISAEIDEGISIFR